jgi:hypothetical protein
MIPKRNAVAALAALAMLVLAPAAANATPGSGAPTATITFSCDGQPLTFVVESRGIFGTAYIDETGQTFVPTSFTLDGQVLSAKAAPLPQAQISCTTSTPGGELVVTGFFVPPTG